MPVTLPCAVCARPVTRPPSKMRNRVTVTCSRRCNGAIRGAEWATYGHTGRAAWTDASRASYREKISGERNPAWKGGVTLWRKAGNYPSIKYVRAPAWAVAMARKDGYVMEHRLLMAQITGRLLARTEVVHHLDHDPTNNALANLELWPSNGSHKAAEHGRVVPGAANRWPPRSSVAR